MGKGLAQRAIGTAAFGLAVILGGEAAFAHGGSHPTPWPTPPPDTPPPTKPGSPSPTPSSPTQPTGPTTPGLPTGPGTTGTPKKGSAKPSSEMLWETWWKYNQWNYTRVGRRTTQQSGEATGSSPAPAGDWPAVAFLKEALGDAYFDVRAAACIGLGKAADVSASERLIALIDDPNGTVQESAILALGMLKHTGNIGPLMRVIETPGKYPARLQAAAALALGFIGDPAATARLLEILKRGGDDEVQAAAVVALGLLKDRSAYEPLTALITRMTGKQNDTLRAYAVTALGKLGIADHTPADGKKPLVTAELLANLLRGDKADEVQRSAALALGALGDEGNVRELLWAIGNAKDPMVRNFAMLSAARLAKADQVRAAVRRELEKALLDAKDYAAHGFAPLALGVLGDPAAAGLLRRTFQETKDPSPKSACAIGLGLLRDPESRPLLMSTITLERDTTVRGYCCVALGLIGGTQAVPDLRKILETERAPELRAAAAVALANVGDRAAFEVLKKSLGEKNVYLAMTNVLALGYFRDDAVVPDLVKYFKSETNPDVRTITTVAIGYLADRSEKPVLKQVATDFNYLLHYPTIDLVLALH